MKLEIKGLFQLSPGRYMPCGLNTSLDLIYGWRGFFDPSLYPEQNIGMMHKMGFNTKLLHDILVDQKIKGVYSSSGGQITCIIWKQEKPDFIDMPNGK